MGWPKLSVHCMHAWADAELCCYASIVHVVRTDWCVCVGDKMSRRDVPVHLVAGEHDGVIPASNIRHHYAAMRGAGMDVSYREVRLRRRSTWALPTPAIRWAMRSCH